MNRYLYKIEFNEKRIPNWICPICNKSSLILVDKSFIYYETSASLKDQKIAGWNPEWIEYNYNCLLKCSNKNCNGKVINIGKGGVSYDYCVDNNGKDLSDWNNYFIPTYFIPNLHIFLVPKKTPKLVKIEIEKSFNLFFCDSSAAANHIRIALEILLTHLKVKRYTISKKRNRIPLTLHARIEKLPEKYKEYKDLFIAVKWLGNAGSHNIIITSDDVMDIYNILEHILNEIFESKKKHIKKLAKQINKKKGVK